MEGCGQRCLVLMVKSHVHERVKPLVELSIVIPVDERMSLIACSLS